MLRSCDGGQRKEWDADVLLSGQSKKQEVHSSL